MLVFSALTPHPPLIVPEIGKENLKFVEKTVKAMQKLAEELYASKPETIITISPHGQIIPEAFSINMSPKFEINFNDFGDLSIKIPLNGDIGLIHHYKEILETKIPVVLTHQEKLDHGVGVPLYYLTKLFDSNKIKIVPISYSLLDYQAHYDLGRKLQEDIINDTKRIAVIASGDMSHRLTTDAPAGYSHWAKKFDETIIEKIKSRDHNGIKSLDEDFIDEAGECGLRSLIILLGILNTTEYTPEILSYEGPFGVGYLVVNFQLPR
ncbi:MAG: AmmeMemoRadiSam system protein B [Patescibacteria group bacterium]|jgi:AmmeMemoRadiSam system protein B